MSVEHRSYFNSIAQKWKNEPPPQAFVNDLTRFDIRPNDVVLDVGCGAGCAMREVLEIQPKASVIGIDVSEKMLSAAAKNIGTGGVRFLCSDACSLALESGSVHKVICYSTFPHLINQTAALQEFFRVLAPGGGVLIFHNCCSRRLNSFHAKLKDIVAFDKLPKIEMLANMIRSVGFCDVHIAEQPNLYHILASKGKIL